jgi:TM2 domain-containing membrane protein YozV
MPRPRLTWFRQRSVALPSRIDTNGSNAMSTGQGSGGNVLAAICSFFIPGLGQLVQGRLLKALLMFVLAGLLWIVWMGWIIHLWSIIDAALFKSRD